MDMTSVQRFWEGKDRFRSETFGRPSCAQGGGAPDAMGRSATCGYGVRTESLGTKGTSQIGYLRETPSTVLKKEGVIHDTVPYFMERVGQAYITQLKDFIERAVEQEEPSVTIEDGERALLTGHAATRSLHANMPVVIQNSSMSYHVKSEIEIETEKKT